MSSATQGVCLLFALTLSVSATRMDAKSSVISVEESSQHSSMEANSSASWSPWEIKFQGLSCMNLDTAPFVGLHKSWSSCMSSAEKEGKDLASTRNCKVCDVTFKGSKPEAETGLTSTKCSAKVQCSAGRLKPAEACFDNNGPLGKVNNMNSNAADRTAHPNRGCFPCPPECKSCEFDNSYTSWAMGKKSFKCIIKGTGPGATCATPAGFECGECRHRKCGGMANNLISMVTNSLCDNNDFKSECKWNAAFKTPSPAEVVIDDKLRSYTVTMESGRDSHVMPPVMQKLSESQ